MGTVKKIGREVGRVGGQIGNAVTLGLFSDDNPLDDALNVASLGLLDPGKPKGPTVPGQATQDKKFNEGLAKYDQFLGPDAFKSMMDKRSEDKKMISEMRRDQTRGLNARENQSARAMYENTLRNSGSTQRAALASNLASRGLQGGFAGAQAAGLESALANQMNQAGNQLMMQNVNLRAQGLNNFENTVSNQEQEARAQLLNRLALGEGEIAKLLEMNAAKNAGKGSILDSLGDLLGI